MEAWVTGLVGVALGCAGSAAGTAINNYYQARRDGRNKRLEFSRGKIEEAYQLLLQIDNLFLRVYTSENMLSVKQEQVFNESEKVFREFLQRLSVDSNSEMKDKIEELYASLKMLAALYLPVLDQFLMLSDSHYTSWLVASGDEHLFWIDLYPSRPRELTQDELDELEEIRDVIHQGGYKFSATCKEMQRCLSDFLSDVTTKIPLKHKKILRGKTKAISM